MVNSYKNYKSSQERWFKKIPEHWDTFRFIDQVYLKHGYQFRDYDFTRNGIKIIKISQLNPKGSLDLNNCSYIDPERLKSFQKIRIKEGDILMALTGGTIGKIIRVGKLKDPLLQNYRVGNFYPNNKRLTKDFLYFLLSSQITTEQINYLLNRNGQPNIGKESFKNMFFPLPSKKEQKSISAFLEYNVQTIDKKIKLLQEKIAIYKEYRNSLINETVTRGLNKKVRLKDSGIEWIGEIPTHWKISRIKDNCTSITGNSISDKSQYEIEEDSISYIATKDINIETNSIHYDNGIYIPKKDKNFKISKRNSTLLCLEGANAGKKIAFSNRNIAFVNKLASIKSSSKDLDDKYLFYVIQSGLFKNQFFAEMSGLIGGVSLGIIRYFNIIIPPKKNQIEIAEFLDSKTETIDKVVGNIKKQIKTLKELRKTLINDVVTGKIKVTG